MSLAATMRVASRNTSGKGQSRALRLTGMIPGIIYGGDSDNVKLAVDPRDVLKGLRYRGFYTKIFDLNIDGKAERVMCKDVQLHPVTDQPLHIDFLRVNKNTKIHVNIPIKFSNESLSPGIKQGGMINIVIHNLEVICQVDAIPDAFTIDLKGMEIGTSIHLDAIQFPEGVVVAYAERDNTIATIVAPNAEDEKEGAASQK